jgi:hypothetical protein
MRSAWLLTKHCDPQTAALAIALLMLAGCAPVPVAQQTRESAGSSPELMGVCTLVVDIPLDAQSNPTGPDDGWLYIAGKRWQPFEIPYNGKCIEETET